MSLTRGLTLAAAIQRVPRTSEPLSEVSLGAARKAHPLPFRARSGQAEGAAGKWPPSNLAFSASFAPLGITHHH